MLLSLGRLAEAEADLDAALAANPHHAHYPYYQARPYLRPPPTPAVDQGLHNTRLQQAPLITCSITACR